MKLSTCSICFKRRPFGVHYDEFDSNGLGFFFHFVTNTDDEFILHTEHRNADEWVVALGVVAGWVAACKAS